MKSKKSAPRKTSTAKTKPAATVKKRSARSAAVPQRREHARFETSTRVEYTIGTRKAFAFSINLSQTGMLLRNATGLALKSELDFALALNDGDKPLCVRGRVIETADRSGVRVRFVDGQKDAQTRIKRYTIKVIVPALESEVKKAHSQIKHVAELAGLYADAGRVDDATGLYRSQWKKRGPSLQLAEHWVRFMTARLSESENTNLAFLRELEAITEAGLAMGNNAVLTRARTAAEGVRARLERQTRDTEKREREEEVTERVQAEVAKRVKDTLSKALVSQKEEVEAQVARKVRAAEEAERLARETQKELKGKARSTESLLEAEKERIASEREALETEMKSATKGRKTIEKRERELEEMQATMERERASIANERVQLNVERDAFNEMQSALRAQKKSLGKLEEALSERVRELDKRASDIAGQAASQEARSVALDAKAAKRKAELDAHAASQEAVLETKLAEEKAILEARFMSRQTAAEARLAEQNKAVLKEQQAALEAKNARHMVLLGQVESRAAMLAARGEELSRLTRDLELREGRITDLERQAKSEQALQDLRFRDLQQELLERDAEVKRLNAALDELKRVQTVRGTFPERQRDDTSPLFEEKTRVVTAPPPGGFGFAEERTTVDMRRIGIPKPTAVQAEISVVKATYPSSGEFSGPTRFVKPRVVDAVDAVEDDSATTSKGRDAPKTRR